MKCCEYDPMPVFGMLGIRKIKIRCSCFSLKFEIIQMILFSRAGWDCLQKLFMIILVMGCLINIVIIIFQVNQFGAKAPGTVFT
jgi:hypothetical protein